MPMLKMHFKFSLSAIKKIKTNGSEYRNFAQGLALVLIILALLCEKSTIHRTFALLLLF
jgi:hypothetical protein